MFLFQIHRSFFADDVLSAGWILSVLQTHSHLVITLIKGQTKLFLGLYLNLYNIAFFKCFPAALLHDLPGTAGGTSTVRHAGGASESNTGSSAVPALSPPAAVSAAQQSAGSAPNITSERGIQVCCLIISGQL